MSFTFLQGGGEYQVKQRYLKKGDLLRVLGTQDVLLVFSEIGLISQIGQMGKSDFGSPKYLTFGAFNLRTQAKEYCHLYMDDCYFLYGEEVDGMR